MIHYGSSMEKRQNQCNPMNGVLDGVVFTIVFTLRWFIDIHHIICPLMPLSLSFLFCFLFEAVFFLPPEDFLLEHTINTPISSALNPLKSTDNLWDPNSTSHSASPSPCGLTTISTPFLIVFIFNDAICHFLRFSNFKNLYFFPFLFTTLLPACWPTPVHKGTNPHQEAECICLWAWPIAHFHQPYISPAKVSHCKGLL